MEYVTYVFSIPHFDGSMVIFRIIVFTRIHTFHSLVFSLMPQEKTKNKNAIQISFIKQLFDRESAEPNINNTSDNITISIYYNKY